jgi:hypothetical protein
VRSIRLVAALALSGCNVGLRPVRSFEQLVGCYAAENGSSWLEIRRDGRVIVEGTDAGLARLDVRGPATLVRFSPAIFLSEQGGRVVTTTGDAAEHLVHEWRGKIELAVHDGRFENGRAATILVRRDGACSW